MMSLWYSQKARLIATQVILVSLLASLAWMVWGNVQNNLEVRDIQSGFAFLSETAGFSIIMHLIDFDEASSYLQVFLVGLLNTLLVSFIGIILATIMGFTIGIGRLAHNQIVRGICAFYIETIRNVPLLLQIFFWYFAVLRALPHPKQSWEFAGCFLNLRGLYLPAPNWSEWAIYYAVWLVLLVVALFAAGKRAKAVQLRTGHKPAYRWMTTVVMIVAFMLMLLIIGPIQSWDSPALKGFNFQGGMVLIPEFIALVLALFMYTAAFIAEIVRLGIQSVDKGQKEAAFALGLSKNKVLSLVVIPQALRVILPPLTNQYLNLTKNSSLAAAIGYPDLVAVFSGTVLNQTGQAIEVIGLTMAVYLTISLSISAIMLAYERATSWGR